MFEMLFFLPKFNFFKPLDSLYYIFDKIRENNRHCSSRNQHLNLCYYHDKEDVLAALVGAFSLQSL